MATLTTRYPEGPILHDILEIELPDPTGEEVLHLSNARVVLAEYELLQHDFVDLRTENLLRLNPRWRDLEREARDEAIRSTIDAWLIANAAFISTPQARQAVVNTPIPVDGRVARAYRPKDYGRAIVLPLQCAPSGGDNNQQGPTSPGLLDLKGAGVAPGNVPSHEWASDGLDALWSALKDHLRQRAIDAIFARELPERYTVPTYAVLDLGFDMTGPWRGARAGMHVRRAHQRGSTSWALDPIRNKMRLEMELLFRKYGLTAANAARAVEIFDVDGRLVQRMNATDVPKSRMTLDQIGLCLALKGRANYLKIEQFEIQTGSETISPPDCHLIDFGTIHARKTFDLPLSRGPRISLQTVDCPGSKTFVQPDPEVALPIATWATRRMNACCSELARQFSRNELSPKELRSRLEEPLHRLIDKWSQKPVTLRA
jgi:hypothetical protein